VGITPSAAYFSIKSGRMPSDAKNIALLVNGQVDSAALGAANAPTGSNNIEMINMIENKRSKRARFGTLLRLFIAKSNIVYSPLGKLNVSYTTARANARRSLLYKLDIFCPSPLPFIKSHIYSLIIKPFQRDNNLAIFILII
jgi:hypothetical protein